MGIDRRTALKVLAGGSAVAACGIAPAQARVRAVAPPGAIGMLYDTTRCIGCKTCVVACKEANGMPADRGPFEDGKQLYDAPTDLNGSTKNVIKVYRSEGRQSFVKAQCMHCVDPACASACMLKSLHKDEVTGIVSYDPAYCVGCRYCQMACPFNVPKFEFGKNAPKIVKCELCRHRVKDAAAIVDGFTRYPKGQGPACCEVCPREAVIYGKRDELLEEAKRRIAENPGRYYQDHVYGETEAGGTQVMYLSHLPFSAIGLPELTDQPVPEVAYTVQDGIYHQLPFVAPVGLYAVLAAVMIRNRRANKDEGNGGAP